MTDIIPASKWGRELKGTTSKMSIGKVAEMTVHYTGAPSVQVSKAGVPGYIKRIERQHQARPGDQACATIAYNFIIDKWGRIWEGRGWDYINAANGARRGQPSSNPVTFSVLVLVGVEDNAPNEAITQALEDLYKLACKRLRRRELAVQGHKDHVATSCPGPKLYRLVKSGKIQGKK